jgi:hypothetical protein
MINMYYLAAFARPKGSKDKQKRKRRNENIKTVASTLAPAIGIYSRVPEKLLAKGSVTLLTRDILSNKRISDREVSQLSKKYNVPVRYGKRNEVIGNSIVLDPKLGTVSSFYHELGHLQDKKIIRSVAAKKSSVKYTLTTLRNEGIANINAIKTRGVKQLPHALGSYGGYLSWAFNRHRRGLAGVALGAGIIKAILDRKKKNKNRYD